MPAPAAEKFYRATAQQVVQSLGAGVRRISLDGHNLPRYTQIVDLVKGKIGNPGRTRSVKAEEMVLAFDLDARLWLALRVYQGTKKLSRALVEIVQELLAHRGDLPGVLRFFFDKGGYCGAVFRDLLQCAGILFYTPAVRYATNARRCPGSTTWWCSFASPRTSRSFRCASQKSGIDFLEMGSANATL